MDNICRATTLTIGIEPRWCYRVRFDPEKAREWRRIAGDSVQVEQTSRQGWARLAVTGELDMSTALTFRRRLRALRAANTPVCLDLSGVEFIDSAGAYAVLDAVAASRQGPWHVRVEPQMSGQARRYFDLLSAAGLRVDF